MQFRQLTVYDGLSQNTVNYIMQDTRGFLWFCTLDGLNRYDGYQFKVYRSEHGTPHTLSNNTICSIIEDSYGRIWIGTYDGLNIFNRYTESFLTFKSESDEKDCLSHNFIQALCEDKNGRIWIGTDGGGLNRCFPDSVVDSSLQFSVFRSDVTDPKSILSDYINCIYEDHSGRIWIGTGAGLAYISPKMTLDSIVQFVPVRAKLKHHLDLSRIRINTLFEDQNKNLWIGTDHGLVQCDSTREVFHHFEHTTGDQKGLANNVIRAIYQDRRGVLWVGTYGGGLHQFNPQNNEFICYQHDPNNRSSINNNRILSIFEDHSGVLWVGIYSGGINYINREKKPFLHYHHEENNSNSLNHDMVFSIWQDQSENLWVGTFDGGLNCIHRETGKVKQYLHDPKNRNSLSDNNVRSFLKDQFNNFWIGTTNGLTQWDRSKGRFTVYQNDPQDTNSISHNYIRALCKDHFGHLWIGTDNGLNRFDYQTNRFQRFLHNPDDSTSISHDRVWSILEDHLGNLWIGTCGGGLSQFHWDTQNFTHYKSDLRTPNSISYDYILSLFEDYHGNLWIGTDGGGLNQFHRESGTFSLYDMRYGLPNNTIYGILEDRESNLWLSHNKGLSKFNPNFKTFRNYDVYDGLQSNEFNARACFQSPEGEMFFGGINGVTAFFPEQIKDNTARPYVVITGFQIFNKDVPVGPFDKDRIILEQSITETQVIELTHHDRMVSFEFAGLHYVNPESNQYAYKLEGFEEEWNYVGSRRYATYTNLSPGEYIFHVKASNSDGVWSEASRQIAIKIKPPFAKTLAFRIISIIALSLIVYAFYEIRMIAVRRKERELEERVRERTATLELTSAKLETMNKELQDFAYIISHDLKAPLRAISHLAFWIARDNKNVLDKKNQEKLDILVHRVHRMNDLITGILQYSRAGRVTGQKSRLNIQNLVEDIIDSLNPPKSIQIDIINQLPIIFIHVIPIERIFQNLITNAIKYMDKDKGKIEIAYREENDEHLFSVKDNGPGIHEKHHKRIFQLFQTVKRHDTIQSTGIGLAVVKKTVNELNGRIWLESQLNRGSTFYFSLPKDETPSS